MSKSTAKTGGRGDKPGEKRSTRKFEPVFEVVDLDDMSDAEITFGEEFDKRLIGQPEARQIALDVRARLRNPMRNKKHPLGIYYLVGKSRRGKSLLAQTLAYMFHGDEDALTRITSEDYYDDSQMMDLIGAPPKYVGYRKPVEMKALLEDPGRLAQVDGYSKVTDWNRIRVRMHSGEVIDIVVLEEFSKSGPDFFKFWMEVFDKGKKALGNGEMANFQNTVFILTDNLAMDKVEKEEKGGGIGFIQRPSKKLAHEEVVDIVKEAMTKRFPPEFRNRIDQVTVYRELDRDQTMQVVDIQVAQFQDRIIDQMPRGDDFTLQVDQSAREFLLKEAEEDVANLKRTIMKHMEVPMGRMLDRDNPNKILGGDLVRVTWDGKSNRLSFGIARGEGDTDENIEGLKTFLGDTPASMKGVALQRRISKLRGAVTRENIKEWTVVMKADTQDDLASEVGAIQHELTNIYGLKISNLLVAFEAPYQATFYVRGSKEQMDMVADQYPELTVKEMTRALVPVDPKKS
jgi:hypothetical protein